MALPIFICDAFVGQLAHQGENRVLRGNPAAVVLLDEFRSDDWLQNVAAEFNLSETAFLVPRAADEWNLRWFTPTLEVDLCGHATLASSHVLWHAERATGDELKFHTRSGVLGARRSSDSDSDGGSGDSGGSDGNERIALDFPAQPVKMMSAPPELLEAVGLRAHADPVVACRADDDWLFKVAGGRVETLKPDFARLRELAAVQKWRGVMVTARAPRGASYDFSSRFFGAGAGVDEDPVTGSAHTKLAPFWGGLLKKDAMTAVQLSPRGGRLELRLRGERVEIAGRAQVRVSGQWLE